MFSPGRNVREGEEQVQHQHHDSPLQLGDSSWQQNTHSNNPNDGVFGTYRYTIAGSGAEPGHNILPNNPYNSDYDSPGSHEPHSRYGTLDSYTSTDTSYSRPGSTDSGYIDPKLTQANMASKFQYQAYWDDRPPLASPDQLTNAPLSPPSFPRQSDSSTQATGYGTTQSGGYFGSYHIYQQHPIAQPGAIGPQEEGIHHSPRVSGPMSSPLLPDQPTHHDKKQESAGYCHDCGKWFTRPTDLDRHLRTTKKHSEPSGPACPESDCQFTTRFSRCDNFKAHYIKQHGKSDAEAEEFLRQWKAQANPGFLTGASGRVRDSNGRERLGRAGLMRGSGVEEDEGVFYF